MIIWSCLKKLDESIILGLNRSYIFAADVVFASKMFLRELDLISELYVIGVL